jgi:predicted Zn-dependent peptidase
MTDFVRQRVGGRERSARSQTASDGSGVANDASTSRSGSSSGAGSSVESDDAADVTEQLRKFAELRDDGIISQEEFERKKQELLE